MYSFAAFASMLVLPICDGSLGLLYTYITGNLSIRVIERDQFYSTASSLMSPSQSLVSG